MFKVCTICNTEKSLTEFNKRSTSKDGYQNICRICNSIAGKKHYENNKDKIKNRTKVRKERIRPLAKQLVLSYLEKGCIDCGEKDIVVLDFDHQSNKEDSICRMVHDAISLDKLENEISKCEIRCANCHRRKTAKDFNWWRTKL